MSRNQGPTPEELIAKAFGDTTLGLPPPKIAKAWNCTLKRYDPALDEGDSAVEGIVGIEPDGIYAVGLGRDPLTGDVSVGVQVAHWDNVRGISERRGVKTCTFAMLIYDPDESYIEERDRQGSPLSLEKGLDGSPIAFTELVLEVRLQRFLTTQFRVDAARRSQR